MTYRLRRANLLPRMIWLRYAIAVAVILITGRIHSKRLDEQDEPDAQEYFGRSPLCNECASVQTEQKLQP
jgi:hypothetical protein